MTDHLAVILFDLGDTLVDASARRWLPNARELVNRLATLDRPRVGLLSNTSDLDRQALLGLLPADFEFALFDSELVLLSSETGFEKPDLRAFHNALLQAGVPPWQCLFVGESWVETLAAQLAGMRSVRIAEATADFRQLAQSLNVAIPA